MLIIISSIIKFFLLPFSHFSPYYFYCYLLLKRRVSFLGSLIFPHYNINSMSILYHHRKPRWLPHGSRCLSPPPPPFFLLLYLLYSIYPSRHIYCRHGLSDRDSDRGMSYSNKNNIYSKLSNKTNPCMHHHFIFYLNRCTMANCVNVNHSYQRV